MKVLIEQGVALELLNDDSIRSMMEQVQNFPNESIIDDSMAEILDQLWKSQSIQDVYTQRHNFQLPDSAKYYLNKIKTIGDVGYVPSIQDVLRSRVRTSGIVEERYIIDRVPFQMYDVGGQRNERKKWIHCFDNVNAGKSE